MRGGEVQHSGRLSYPWPAAMLNVLPADLDLPVALAAQQRQRAVLLKFSQVDTLFQLED